MLAGIDAALDAGLDPVKVNCVVMRGVNDDEVVDLAALRPRAGRRRALHRVHAARRRRASGASDQVVPAARDPRAHRRGVPARARRRRDREHVEPAERFRYRDGIGDVGVIAERHRAVLRAAATASASPPRASSAPACSRSTSSTCAPILRGGGLDDELDDRLADAIDGAVGTKWAGHRIGQVDFVRPDRSMSQIGG